MKRMAHTGIACLLFFSAAIAQESNVSPGLRITDRTTEERIEFLLQVAQAYLAENDLDSAIDAYKRAVELDPKHREALNILATTYIAVHQYGEAEKILLEQIEEFPEDFRPKNNLAWLYATATDLAYRNGKKGVRLAQEAMILDPNNHHVWNTLAEAYYVSGEYEKAYRAIQHMAALVIRYGKNVTREAIEGYNGQIRKCKRALDMQKLLSGEEDAE